MIAKLVQVAPLVMGDMKETASYEGHKHNKHMSVYIYKYVYVH